MDELYESFDGETPDELNLICLASLPVLHEISLRVIRAGYTKELLHAFSNAPCDVLDRYSVLVGGGGRQQLFLANNISFVLKA